MSTRKQRWADRAVALDAAAQRNEATAHALLANQNRDPAFLSQPGRLPGRAREIARADRAYTLLNKSSEQKARASNLKTMAERNAGDAETERVAKREALSAELQVGDFVDSIYGRRRVLKINRKSVRLEGHTPLTIDKSLCRKVAP